jgi:kinesin family protein 1
MDRGAKCIVQMKGNQTILVPPPDAEERMRAGKGGAKDIGQKVFAFDKSYWSFDKSDPTYAGQDNLHDDLGKPLLDNAFQGYNNCIFAYGQTGSGKSYSMMGYGKEAGVIPKICQDMFKRIGEMQQDKNLRCTVEVSYLEIYNERVRDLLNPSTKGNLKVREHPSTGPYVEDLAKLVVSSFNEIENLMDEGNKARTVAATNMNETSSRSHAVFTLTLTQKRHDVETNMAMEKVAKISLVDLAGSERATSTGATGARLKEGAEINRSLSTLGRVIAALADLSEGKKKKTGKGAGQVPYRDSVLTWLLKDSLGGNSMTAMIAAISPADINFDETLSTLRYADSAKRIKNHAVVNEDANARMIRELKEELTALRSKLSGGGGGATEEIYAEGTPLDQQIVSIVQPDGSVKKVSKAEIAEQLNQSEKLYSDLNQTWEQKLQKTEEIHKEREAALEELGISIEKGFVGLHTPKKMPHLVNLSDDPLLAECLVYNLKPGTTTVGNVDASFGAHTSEIRLNGSRILHDHCSFENIDNVVTLVPREGASVMVNGKRIVEPHRLRSGYRVILGDFHIFRFNNPMEARAERAEQSSLRHSIIANSLSEFERASPSPSPRPGHERTFSKANSEAGWDLSRPDSPMPTHGRDSDWSFARREAAGAILGPDKQIAGLTDEELNILFEDVQKARAERAVQNMDDDMDSVTSYPVREKYMSNGTLDNFSLDTALTMPSTPKQGEVEDKMREVREEMQVQLDKQKEEYQEQLKSAEAANVEVEEIRKEKARMEENLREVKEEMMKQLEAQRKEFEERLESMAPREKLDGFDTLSPAEIAVAESVIEHWRRRRYVRMAEAVLQSAANLKEAQIMSQEMGENVVFQFAIVDVGHDQCSSYDMVLNDISGEGDDIFLEQARKPCVAVRVMDYRNSVVHLWSLEKLQDRVRLMRQMHQYMDRPEYLKHFALDNPFMETCMPQYTHIGDVDVPLAAVFESRVQDFSLDVLSPYTSHAIGLLKLSLEPSSARAPSSTLKFNVVMHDLVGFAEREGTELHAQLFIPSAEGGVTTTQMIKDFDEGPIRFESVHSMSVPMFGPTDVSLRVAIFAKVSSMHLDKLLSWDDMRDNVPRPKQKRKNARIAESQFYTEEKHDVFARIQILELAETGEYLPVEVIQTHNLDKGTFQLHQGLQRRIVISLTHSSGDALPWDKVSGLRVGAIQLIDHTGKAPDLGPTTPEIALKLTAIPNVSQNANGTSNVTLVGQWDSSAHESVLLNRVTSDKYKVQMSLVWDVTSPKLADPVPFRMNVCSQILSRSYVRSTSMFSSLFQTVRIVHSRSEIFSISVRPTPVKRAGDLWRMNTQNDYVKGEEGLTDWTPRGVSLIKDYIAAKRRKQRLAEIEAAQPLLNQITFPVASPPAKVLPQINGNSPTLAEEGEAVSEESVLSEHDKTLLEKYLKLWKLCHDPISSILTSTNVEPPATGAPSTPSTGSTPATSCTLLASISVVAKNPNILKGGELLMPSSDSTRWVRRFVELRRPYMHIHSIPDGEEICIVSLRNSRVDHQPQIARLLRRETIGAGGAVNARGRRGKEEDRVFAVYGTDNTWLFKARSETEKIDWIFKLDQSYFGSAGGSGDGSDGDYGY